MNRAQRFRRVIRLLAPPLAAFTVLAAGVSCYSAECESLRNRLYAERRGFEECDPGGNDCIIVGGQGIDCTGAYKCNFAVNKRHRDAAEQAVLRVATQQQVCGQAACSAQNCPIGEISICEPVSRRCIIVGELVASPTPTSRPPVTIRDAAAE